MTSPIYLDYNATTRIDPRVLESMLPWLREGYGNPSSDHVYGRAAKSAVAAAREQVAALIGARPDEIVFTGCATEANNLALLGAAHALREGGRRGLLCFPPSSTPPWRNPCGIWPRSAGTCWKCRWMVPGGLIRRAPRRPSAMT